MKPYLSDLNSNQLAAACSIKGRVASVAGPGSGKTKTLVAKYVYLVDECGVDTSRILCTTFSNAAANELKARIRTVLLGDGNEGNNLDLSWVSTIHGVCRSILRKDGNVVFLPKNAIILDEQDVKAMLEEARDEVGLTSQDLTLKDVKAIVHDFAYNENSEPYYEAMVKHDTEAIRYNIKNASGPVEELIYRYCYKKKQANGVDFDDLLLLAYYVLVNDKKRGAYWANQFEYILVDEAQDLNKVQMKIINILARHSKSIYGVGDVDQCIYKWRSAVPEIFATFAETADHRHDLEVNYRSGDRIVRASQDFIANNANRLEHKLVANRNDDGELIYSYNNTDKEEANYIARKINELTNGTDGAYSFNDVAILARSRDYMRSIEEALVGANIPYKVLRGTTFYDHKLIKTIISYLKLVIRLDDASFLSTVNVPKRGMGTKKLDALKDFASINNKTLFEAMEYFKDDRNLVSKGGRGFVEAIEYLHRVADDKSIDEMLQSVLDLTGLEARLNDEGDEDNLRMLAELKSSIRNYQRQMDDKVKTREYLGDIALYTDPDIEDDKDQPKVTISTIHSAKGLEWPVVFVCRMNQNEFPSKHATSLAALEEERNVAYVAFTRAKDKLFLTSSAGVEADQAYRRPSRFIFELDGFLIIDQPMPEEMKQKASRDMLRMDQMLFNKAHLISGTRVAHEIFGEGTVLQWIDDCISVQFDADKTETHLRADAPLKLAAA